MLRAGVPEVRRFRSRCRGRSEIRCRDDGVRRIPLNIFPFHLRFRTRTIRSNAAECHGKVLAPRSRGCPWKAVIRCSGCRRTGMSRRTITVRSPAYGSQEPDMRRCDVPSVMDHRRRVPVRTRVTRGPVHIRGDRYRSHLLMDRHVRGARAADNRPRYGALFSSPGQRTVRTGQILQGCRDRAHPFPFTATPDDGRMERTRGSAEEITYSGGSGTLGEAGRTFAKRTGCPNTECPHQALVYDCPVNVCP